MKRKNHFVARSYLKNWASEDGKVWCYRILVPHKNVPIWKAFHPSSIAYQQDLYTRHAFGKESDFIENWFAEKFENPAQSAINAVINDDKLSVTDWENLIRFFALQDVRTPARLLEHLKRTRKMLPKIMDEVLGEAKNALESGQLKEFLKKDTASESLTPFPLRVVRRPDDDPEKIQLGIHSTPGRATWPHSIAHVLENAAKLLHSHKWTIIKPAFGMQWPTSDNPAVKLNYFSKNDYNFGGGYVREGSELFLPLSPRHLMYTKVGSKPPMKGSRFDAEVTQLIRKFIIESAHRLVISTYPDESIVHIRKRTVDAHAVIEERRQWRNWDYEQSHVEEKYFPAADNKKYDPDYPLEILFTVSPSQCPCGSGRKPQKCCGEVKPRNYSISMSLENYFESDGLALNLNEVQVERLVGDKVSSVLGDTKFRQSYSRPKGEKSLVEATQQSNAKFEPNALFVQYEHLFTIDTNTKEVDGETISISCVIHAFADKLSDTECKLNYMPLAFFDCRNADVPPENLGWMILSRAISENAEYSGKKIGLVVDSDKDKLGRYNQRLEPIVKDYVIPTNQSLIYASADSGNSILNKLIKKCDKKASAVMEEIIATNHDDGLQLSEEYPCKKFRQLTPNFDDPSWII